MVSDFLIGQGYNMGPANIGQDNKSTMTMAEVGKSTSERTRHTSVRYFWIKDRIDSNEISLSYVPTNVMIADYSHKVFKSEQFRNLRSMLLNA